jgi:aminopeptidase N
MTAPQTTTYLKDYRPFPFTLGEVALTFRLAAKTTRVLATIPFTPAGPKADLVLFGEGLKPVSLRIDGTELSPHDYQLTEETLTVPASRLPSGTFLWQAEVEIDPKANTALEGLYLSERHVLHPMRGRGLSPHHLLSRPPRRDGPFEVTHRNSDLPVLLSNGNPGRAGRWLAVWQDPWPKPAYLFALVAGDLRAVSDNFTTMSGRKVRDLNVWVRPGDEDRCGYAMEALIRSMKWDEEVYGREYDLDVFNIVAVSDFNMGAMENKGLNIFNSKLVLASPRNRDRSTIERIEA